MAIPNAPYRNYLAEMTTKLEIASRTEPGKPNALLAQELVIRLRTSDPQLLAGYMDLRAASILTQELTRMGTVARLEASRNAPLNSFSVGAREAERGFRTGRPVQSWFAIRYVINSDNARKLVADMTGADHRYVADDYQRSAVTAKMLAAFHRAVADKVGDKRTEEVMSETEYDRLYRSIIK